MRPTLARGPALWRDPDSLQFGLRPASVLRLDALDEELASALAGLDGTRTLADLPWADRPDGGAAVLHRLQQAGVIDDAAADVSPLRTLDPVARATLCQDVAAVARRHGRARAAATLAGRAAATVEVRGGGRIGSALATLLAGSGIGRIRITDRTVATAADAVPGGIRAGDSGRSRQDAAAAALATAAPDCRTPGPDARRDLVVLADGSDLDPATGDALQRAGVPHLVVVERGGAGQVGPLVVPGRTPCLRCLDHHRTDADARWPQLALQVSTLGPDPVEAHRAWLLAALAARAALEHLAAADPASDHPARDATVTYVADGLPWAERVPVHPRCGCGWRSPEPNPPLPATMAT